MRAPIDTHLRTAHPYRGFVTLLLDTLMSPAGLARQDMWISRYLVRCYKMKSDDSCGSELWRVADARSLEVNVAPHRWWILCGIAGALIVALLVHGPIAQPMSYHGFADQRTLFGIPHFWNVVSNLPFLVIGGLGLRLVARGYSTGGDTFLRPAYLTFFIGVLLVALGSGYYHLSPGNATLLWDRLPMTLAFTAYFIAVLGERVHAGVAKVALPPVLMFGVASVLWWQLSGDLRPYVLVQFLPVILVPVIVVLYPSDAPRAKWVWGVFAGYLVAKGFETVDTALYDGLGFGGHALKHLAAAAAVYCVAFTLRAPR